MKKIIILVLLFNCQSVYSQWHILCSGYPNVSLIDITQTSSGKIIAVGTGFFGLNFTPHIFTSDNDGMNWDTTQIPPTGYFFHSIGFLNNNLGYIGGYGSQSMFLKTTDAGAHWSTDYSDPVNTGIQDIEVIDANHALACGFGAAQFMSGSAYTLTSTTPWTPTSQTFPTASLDDMQMLGMDTGYAVSFSDSGMYKTVNGGTTWDPLYHFPQRMGKTFWWNTQRGIAVGKNGQYSITSDAGSHWASSAIAGYTAELTGVAFYNDSNGFACSVGGNIFQTTNGGSTWTHLSTIVTTDLYNMEIHGHSVYAVGDNGTILRYAFTPTYTHSPAHTSQNIIFPNPADQSININSTGAITSITVHDIMGNTIYYQDNVNDTTHSIDTKLFLNGMYIIQLQNPQNCVIYTVEVHHR